MAEPKRSLIDDAIRLVARRHEPDRWLAALLAPSHLRADLATLAAFAAEVGRVGETVREPMMGEIRLQWWRDAVAGAARGELSGHPVADALAATLGRHAIPPGLLIGTIDAREGMLRGEPPADEGALRTRLAKTEAALFEAAWIILGQTRTTAADALCAEAGVAYGIARGLAHPARALARGELPVTGASPHMAPIDPALLAEARRRAEAALGRARAALVGVPAAAVCALLPLAMVEPYLKAQRRRPGRDPLEAAEPSPLARVWHLWRAHRTRRV